MNREASHETDQQRSGARHGEPRPVDCSVLVPVLNEERHIAASIAAMQAQRFDGRLEFLLVDGGSSDRTGEILRDVARADPRVRLLQNPRQVIPSGLNVALGHAQGRWVARMDAHTEYPADYIQQGVERLNRAGTRWVSGPAIAVGHGPVSRAVALALRTPLGRGGSRKWALDRSASGAELELDAGVFGGVWERETLLAYGGWDERWWRNEDSEMAGRFLAAGERLVCIAAMASRYSPRDSLRGVWRQHVANGEFRAKTAIRHPQTMRRSNLLASGVVLALAGSLAGPRAVRRVARAGVLIYTCALASAGVVALRDAQQAPDAALVPVVLALMHVGFGAGTLKGFSRHAPALAAVVRGRGARPPGEEPVFAPSLQAARASAS